MVCIKGSSSIGIPISKLYAQARRDVGVRNALCGRNKEDAFVATFFLLVWIKFCAIVHQVAHYVLCCKWC